MARNEIYNDITFIPIRMTNSQANNFMKRISNNPTNLRQEYVVRDIRSGSRIYFNLK